LIQSDLVDFYSHHHSREIATSVFHRQASSFDAQFDSAVRVQLSTNQNYFPTANNIVTSFANISNTLSGGRRTIQLGLKLYF